MTTFIVMNMNCCVVGAGGSVLRAALGGRQAGLKTPCVYQVFPPRSPTVRRKAVSPASLGQYVAVIGAGTCMHTVRASDWAGDQDSIEVILCVTQCADAVYELEHWGHAFFAPMRQNFPASLWRDDQNMGQAQRRSALRAAGPPPATLLAAHAYWQSLPARDQFLSPYVCARTYCMEKASAAHHPWKLMMARCTALRRRP